ncbi:MAG: hypothetical protein RPR97_15910 [Colwellia sp.]
MDSDWKEMEKVVCLIEKSINKDSEVLHNQNLKVINPPSSSGRTRQCDVVILSSGMRRQTVTIVEVQNRNSKVDINTFNGWLEKLKEVGAQHLICVSRLDFPVSVKEKAEVLGSTVMLIKLQNEQDDTLIPIQLMSSMSKYSCFQLKEIRGVEIAFCKKSLEESRLNFSDLEEVPLKGNDLIFSYDRINRTNFHRLSRNRVKESKLGFSSETTLKYSHDVGKNIFFICQNKFIKLKQLDYQFDWVHKEYDLIPTYMSYEQLGDGNLAWVLDFTFNADGTRFSIQLPFTCAGDSLELSHLQAETNRDLVFTLNKRSGVFGT